MSRTVVIEIDMLFCAVLILAAAVLLGAWFAWRNRRSGVQYEEFGGISYDAYDWNDEAQDYPFHHKQSPLPQPATINLFQHFQQYTHSPRGVGEYGQFGFGIGHLHAISQPYPAIGYSSGGFNMNGASYGSDSYSGHYPMQNPYERFNDSNQLNLIRQRPMNH